MNPDQLRTLGLNRRRLAKLEQAIPTLHRWFKSAAREMPWRRTSDPYAIWVSEVMLQQTQVVTVIPYYERWLEALPTVESLASADIEQVLRLWEGLGYYSRARNLHRAARQVLERHGGVVPDDPAAFRALSGVGPYTAAAVQSIAFGHDLAVVDGNVRRVLARVITLEMDPRSGPTSRAMDALALALLSSGEASRHNQALMELGALVCTPRTPGCGSCPLAPVCRARIAGAPEAYTRRPPPKKVPHRQVAIGIVQDDQGRLLIQRRPYDGLLGGLWEFPGGKVEPGESAEEAVLRELREEQRLEVTVDRLLPLVNHAYTHFKVTLHPHLCTMRTMDSRAGEGQPHQWVALDRLADFPMPRANRKVLAHLHGLVPDAQKVDKR